MSMHHRMRSSISTLELLHIPTPLVQTFFLDRNIQLHRIRLFRYSPLPIFPLLNSTDDPLLDQLDRAHMPGSHPSGGAHL